MATPTSSASKRDLRPGDHVRLHGLVRAAHYNGAEARVLVPDVGDGTGRAEVQLELHSQHSNRLVVSPERLEILTEYH